MNDIRNRDLLAFVNEIYHLPILEKNYKIRFGSFTRKDAFLKVVKYLPDIAVNLVLKRIPGTYLTESKLASLILLLGSPYCIEDAEDFYKRYLLLSVYTSAAFFTIKKDELVDFIRKTLIDLCTNEIEYILRHKWYFLTADVDLNKDDILQLLKFLRFDRHKLRFQNNHFFWGQEKPPTLKEILLKNVLLIPKFGYLHENKKLSDAIGINILENFALVEYFALRSIKKINSIIEKMFKKGVFKAELEKWRTLVQERFKDAYEIEDIIKYIKKLQNLKTLEQLESSLRSPLLLLEIFFTNAPYKELGKIMGGLFSKGIPPIKEFTNDLKIEPSETYFKLICDTINSYPNELRKEIVSTISAKSSQDIAFCL